MTGDDDAEGAEDVSSWWMDSALALTERPASSAACWGEGPEGAIHPFATAEGARYRDAQPMARGGMGQVSVATDVRLRREVALKEVLPGEPGAAGLEQRLAQEAWITARLEHPGVVPVYDAGRGARGRLFFTMRLVRGRSLRTALADGDLDLPTLLRHFLGVCQTVAYAHARGVVHRDLKPANLMLGAFGESLVVDWGVARVLDDGPGDGGARVPAPPGDLAARTTFGVRVGTPAYMSPEQARAEAPSRAADVWSLGAILFEILTRRPLIAARTADEAFARLEHGPAFDPADAAPFAPPELAAILIRALKRDPAERYADAKQLADDLAAWLDGRPVAAYRYSPWDHARRFGRAFRVPLLVAAAGLLVTALVFAASFAQTLAERDRARDAEAQATAARDQAVSASDRAAAALTQADHSFAALLVQQAQLAQRHGAQAEAELLAAHALLRGASAEARGVLARHGDAPRVDLVHVEPAPVCLTARLSPAGTRLLCREGDATSLWSVAPTRLLWRIDARPEAVAFASEALALVSDEQHQAHPLDLEVGAVLPSGFPVVIERVVTGAGVALGDLDERLVLWREATHEVAPLLVQARQPRAVSGDGQVALTFGEDTHRPLRVDLTTGDHHPMPALPGSAQGPISAALDHVGARAAFGGTRGELRVVDMASGETTWLRAVTDRALTDLRWSPDDAWLAVRDERGWVSLHEARGRAWLALPRLRARDFAWRRHEGALELVLLGDELRVVRPPEAAEARAHGGGAGLATLATSPDGRALVTVAGSGAVQVVAVGTGEPLGELPPDPLRAVAKDAAFLHDAPDELAVIWPGRFRVARWRLGEADARTMGPATNYRRVVAAANGDLLLAGYGVALWLEPRQGPGRAIPVGDGGSPIDAVASADGRVVAWLSSRGRVEVARVGEALGAARAVADAPGAVRVALDEAGEVVAVARQGEVRVLEVASGRVRRAVTVPGERLREVAVAAGGARVAVGTVDGQVWVWGAGAAPEMVGAGHLERVSGLAFLGGEGLVSAGWDGVALRWDLRGLERPAAEWVRRLEATWGVGLEHATRADLW